MSFDVGSAFSMPSSNGDSMAISRNRDESRHGKVSVQAVIPLKSHSKPLGM